MLIFISYKVRHYFIYYSRVNIKGTYYEAREVLEL